MATTHIGANKGDVAKTVLMPGDPLRAKFIAENFLEDAFCFNEVRGMLGYTGYYKGKRVSVMGSGMGMPSLSIYAHELIMGFDVENLIRVGSCGAYQPHVQIRDIILALGASSNNKNNELRLRGMSYAPTASFELLLKAYNAAQEKGIPVKVGNILSSDLFYGDDPEAWKVWQKYGILAVEMETAELYTVAAKFGRRALSILTVSDSAVTKEATTAEEREKTFTEMMEIALEVAE
jgi:purine-nucleoside phosphorylase